MERPDMVHHPRGWLVAESPYPGGGPLAQPQSEALGGAAVLACEIRLRVFSDRWEGPWENRWERRLTGDLVGTNELLTPQLREEYFNES